jgi:hypothetical protein
MKPLTFDINKCINEISECEWVNLKDLCDYNEGPLTKHVARLLSYGKENGLNNIDITSKRIKSIYPGKYFNFFNRNINLNE